MQTTYQRTGDTTYSGWSNHETWLASLWLNNDEYSYKTLLEAYSHGKNKFEQAVWLEDVLRYQFDDECGDPSLWTDLLQSAYSHIDWVEVIERNQE